VFSGMVGEIHENVRASSSDLVVQDFAAPTGYEAVRAVIEADPDVASTAPRLAQVGVYVPRARIGPPGASNTNRPSEALEQRPANYNVAVFLGAAFDVTDIEPAPAVTAIVRGAH